MDQSAAASAPAPSSEAAEQAKTTATETTVTSADATTSAKIDKTKSYGGYFAEFDQSGLPHGLAFDFRNAGGQLQVLHAVMREHGVVTKVYDAAERRDAVILYMRARKQAQITT